MTTINIKDLLGLNSYALAGEKFYQIAREILPKDVINVDMTDVDAIPTIFMNAAFIPLVKDFGKEKVRQSLTFLNVRKSQMERFRRYFESLDEQSILFRPNSTTTIQD